ncbi:MAG: high-potential iron-sulfur protein [Devosia sp.]
MSKTLIDRLSRRQFLGAGVAVTAGVAIAGRAQAQSLEKSAVAYQEEPKDDQRCDNCGFWVPGETAEAMGKCQMVKGDIAPQAWCAIWAPAG